MLAQVAKRRQQGQLSLERRIVQGTQALVRRLLFDSKGGNEVNTVYIERLNAAFRQRLGSLDRRSLALTRTPEPLIAGMYLVSTV